MERKSTSWRSGLVAAIAGLLFLAPSAIPARASADEATAVFAGGCFWCVESDFEHLKGVDKVMSGYAGGEQQNPTYQDHDGHLESVEVFYDPSVVSYRQLVDYFLRHIDPLDDGGQFCDRGHSYTTAIFVASPGERSDAEAAIADAEKILGKKVVTPVRDRPKFWPAEDYHQDYYKKNPLHYEYYRQGCGRDARVKEIWGGR
ncbi:MAG TPA: peptide-methionine (S)-S-oxide reductase MsrA [Parvularculaceae bacterium]|nr:peptide-methionine (S)-S-oxide reductase MsrA [Parvularculaceae bacterium]